MEDTIDPMEETSTDNNTPRLLNLSPIRTTSSGLNPTRDRFKQILHFIEQLGDIDNATPKKIREAINKNNDNGDNPRMTLVEVMSYLPFARGMLSNGNKFKVSPESSPTSRLLLWQAKRIWESMEAVIEATRNLDNMEGRDDDKGVKLDGRRSNNNLQYLNNSKQRILRSMVMNSGRIIQAVSEANSLKKDDGEEYYLKTIEIEEYIRLQRLYLKMILRRCPRWSNNDAHTDDICRRLTEVLSLKEVAATDARVSSGGPIRRRRRPHLIDVNKMVNGLRDLTL